MSLLTVIFALCLFEVIIKESSGQNSCVTYPRPPVNGTVCLDGLWFLSVAEFRCSAGFQLIGHRFTTCFGGMIWSEPTPRCERQEKHGPNVVTNVVKPTTHCASLPVLHSTGRFYISGTNIHDVVQVQCDPGFFIDGPDSAWCMSNGQWSIKEFECKAYQKPLTSTTSSSKLRCKTFPKSLTNGRITVGNNEVGDTVEYQCFPGYTLIGTKTAKCKANLQWSTELRLCLKLVGKASTSMTSTTTFTPVTTSSTAVTVTTTTTRTTTLTETTTESTTKHSKKLLIVPCGFPGAVPAKDKVPQCPQAVKIYGCSSDVKAACPGSCGKCVGP